jgi:hypothetical protein
MPPIGKTREEWDTYVHDLVALWMSDLLVGGITKQTIALTKKRVYQYTRQASVDKVMWRVGGHDVPVYFDFGCNPGQMYLSVSLPRFAGWPVYYLVLENLSLDTCYKTMDELCQWLDDLVITHTSEYGVHTVGIPTEVEGQPMPC